MTQTSLNFQWTLATLAISCAVIALVCTLSFIAWKRSGFRRPILGLELLRIALVCFSVALLNQPESIARFVPTHLPTVVVLADQSKSMQTRDVDNGPAATEPVVSRSSAIAHLLQESSWQELSAEANVVIAPFASGDRN